MKLCNATIGVVAGLAILAGCQETGPQAVGPAPESVVLCNSGGCGVAPADIQTYDPASAVPDPDPEGRLPILIAEAEVDPRAAFDLSMRYMRGDGIRRNSWEAIKWMRDAAERGDLRAQGALGRLYLTGLEETGADYNEAQRWLSLAGSRGDREARRLAREAQDLRAEEQAFQTALRRWRQQYTYGYWYSSRYYGYWGAGYGRYRYY